jgi:hypothetical protein
MPIFWPISMYFNRYLADTDTTDIWPIPIQPIFGRYQYNRYLAPSRYLCRYRYQYICTNTNTDTNIFVLADIWPITCILTDICRYCGQYPCILTDIWPIPIQTIFGRYRYNRHLADTDTTDIWPIPIQPIFGRYRYNRYLADTDTTDIWPIPIQPIFGRYRYNRYLADTDTTAIWPIPIQPISRVADTDTDMAETDIQYADTDISVSVSVEYMG